MEEYYSTSRRETTTTETTLLPAAAASSSSSSYYNPCYCFEVAIRGFLKCLGLGGSSAKAQKEEEEEEEEEVEKNKQSSTQDDDPPPPTSTETGKQKIEDVGVNVVDPRMSSKVNPLVRFPQRPRISSGRPGQINSASS